VDFCESEGPAAACEFPWINDDIGRKLLPRPSGLAFGWSMTTPNRTQQQNGNCNRGLAKFSGFIGASPSSEHPGDQFHVHRALVVVDKGLNQQHLSFDIHPGGVQEAQDGRRHPIDMRPSAIRLDRAASIGQFEAKTLSSASRIDR